MWYAEAEPDDQELAPASAPAKRKRGRPAKPKLDDTDAEASKKAKVYELSVTISAGSRDIDKSVMAKLQAFLEPSCLAGIFAFEKGGTCAHLHVQGVVRAECKGAVSMNRALNKLLGWDVAKPSPGARVMCRALTGKKLHTWHGMIGYCMKDMPEKHYAHVLHNISDDDIAVGQDQYLMHGAGPLKDRCVLTPKNLFERAIIFYNQHERANPRVQLPLLLTRMMQSKKYYPSAEWVIPHQGQGVDMDRANRVWRMLVHPQETIVEDVYLVFSRRQSVPGVIGRYYTIPVEEEQPRVRVDTVPNRNRENLEPDIDFVDDPEPFLRGQEVQEEEVQDVEPVVVNGAPAMRLLRVKHALK